MCILRLPSIQALRAFFGVGVADLKRIPHIAAFDAMKSQLSERVQAAGNEVGFKSLSKQIWEWADPKKKHSWLDLWRGSYFYT